MKSSGEFDDAKCGREVAVLLTERLGITIERRWKEPSEGGCMLTVPDECQSGTAGLLRRMAIHVRHFECEAGPYLAEWWIEAEDHLDEPDQMLVLAYKEKRSPWRLLVPLGMFLPRLDVPFEGVEYTAELSLDAFVAVVKDKARHNPSWPWMYRPEPPAMDATWMA